MKVGSDWEWWSAKKFKESVTPAWLRTINSRLLDGKRQQLILEVLRGIAEATSQQLPGDLSARISGISDIEALYSLLNEEKERLGLKGQPDEKVEMAVRQRLNRVVPGGVQTVLKRDYVVKLMVRSPGGQKRGRSRLFVESFRSRRCI